MSEANSAPAQARPVPIAPAPNDATPPQDADNAQSTKPYTCVTCARRKVKCDKIFPTCTTCRKARLECEYQEPAPRKRKRKPEDEIYERLEHYENLLKQNGILPREENARSSQNVSTLSSPFYTMKSLALGEKDSGKFLDDHGKTRYIDSGIWRNLGEHDYHPSSDEEDDDEEAEQSTQYQPTPAGDPVSAALLGPGSPPSNLIGLHPTYESALKLWRLYVENCDPLVKVVHVPSYLATLQRTAANPSAASKTTEALLFAIYHLALLSISDTECQELFGEPLNKLKTRYHDAVRQALVNVYFLKTTDIAVLQAYILFLLSVRTKYDPHTFWMLTGIAMRIAQRMGLHRDGESHGLKPFDVQIRRRMFWQLIPLDGLAGQLCGCGVSINPDSWDTKQPLNINDTDIWPEMTQPPEPRVGATDTMFCLARTEMGKFVQKAMPLFGNWSGLWNNEQLNEKVQQLQELEEDMETKYLRYCDFAEPLHNMVMAMARTAINSAKLRIRLPRVKGQELSDKEREEVWAQSIKIIDYDIAAQRNGNLQRFMWHLQAFFQWDPLIWVLNEIRRDPLAHQLDPVWDKIENVYAYHPAMLTQRRALHVAVGQLTLKAWDASHQLRSLQDQLPQLEPSFITSLRSFTSKRSNSCANSTVPPTHEYNPFDVTQDTPEGWDASNFTNATFNTTDFDFNGMVDFTPDSMDWMFWNQLVHDPSSFPTV